MPSSLSAFPVTKRWPAQHPDRLQLYSVPTPNGVKVSIMLEEIGLPYEVHALDFGKGDTKSPEFVSLNPNGKIPAILDPNGPGGKPLGLFESGAILHYLADKTKKLMPADLARQWETLAWVHFQMVDGTDVLVVGTDHLHVFLDVESLEHWCTSLHLCKRLMAGGGSPADGPRCGGPMFRAVSEC